MMIRAAPYIAAIAIFVGVLAWIVDSSYEHGRKIERLEWMEHEEILKRQADIRVNQAEAKIRMDKELADRRATQIIGAYANEIEKLHTNLADATDHRLYISAKKPICEADRNAMPGSNESTGGDAAEVRFEIPSAIGRAIRGDYFTAAGLEIKHNALIDLIESRPDCFQVVR
jgi:hypothetical protein